jgi:hypothetical protein
MSDAALRRAASIGAPPDLVAELSAPAPAAASRSVHE